MSVQFVGAATPFVVKPIVTVAPGARTGLEAAPVTVISVPPSTAEVVTSPPHSRMSEVPVGRTNDSVHGWAGEPIVVFVLFDNRYCPW